VRANKYDAGAAAAAAADMLRLQLGSAQGTTEATDAAAPVPFILLQINNGKRQ
jgi:hypothetical protein